MFSVRAISEAVSVAREVCMVEDDFYWSQERARDDGMTDPEHERTGYLPILLYITSYLTSEAKQERACGGRHLGGAVRRALDTTHWRRARQRESKM